MCSRNEDAKMDLWNDKEGSHIQWVYKKWVWKILRITMRRLSQTWLSKASRWS